MGCMYNYFVRCFVDVDVLVLVLGEYGCLI